MVSEKEFKSLYVGNKDLQNKLRKIIDEVISGVDYTKNKRYSLKLSNKNKVIYFYNNNAWEWSWMNSINTNYSCIYLLLKYIEIKFNRNIGYLDFESTFVSNTLDYVESKLKEDKQIIFTPGSDVFKDMFFTAQRSWNWGLISEISAILTIKKHYEIGEVNVNYKRGDFKDMNKGTDLVLYFEDSYKNTQHKSSKLYDNENHYVSYGFIYNELTYRENLDLITIESNNKIHLFRNSKDVTQCGNRDKSFFINKTLEIKQMDKENQEFTNLLMDINRICYENKYIFNFEKGEIGENYFEDSTENSIREIKFYLNDINDPNLVNIVKEQISKL